MVALAAVSADRVGIVQALCGYVRYVRYIAQFRLVSRCSGRVAVIRYTVRYMAGLR
jgi:hypothetical protein